MSKLMIEARPSPNHGDRYGPIDILLLHYTGMPDDEQALAWLRNPESKVSAHYFVHKNGRVFRLVPEDRRAWHAGLSLWSGESDINSRSIGIEIANSGHPGGLPEYPSLQVDAVIALCREILARQKIPQHRVLAHSDVAPGRKLDPGERFPWNRLAAEGVGHFVEPTPATEGRELRQGDSGERVEALQAMLALYGYGIEVTGDYDRKTENAVAAFQRHFRQERIDGVADQSTLSTLQRLIEAIP